MTRSGTASSSASWIRKSGSAFREHPWWKRSPTRAVEASGFAWSKLISSETLEDEVKSLQKQVSENVTTPAKFKGGGFKAGRKQFTELALLFGIIAQYDADVRWKDKAIGVRDLMGRAGQNCKVGTDASFAEAKLRKDDLEQLVQGASINASNGETITVAP